MVASAGSMPARIEGKKVSVLRISQAAAAGCPVTLKVEGAIVG
jgi:hypothetical protein